MIYHLVNTTGRAIGRVDDPESGEILVEGNMITAELSDEATFGFSEVFV